MATFLHDPHDTLVFIKLFYTLLLREREATAVKNTMHIAVWRNLSTANAVCQESTQPLTHWAQSSAPFPQKPAPGSRGAMCLCVQVMCCAAVGLQTLLLLHCPLTPYRYSAGQVCCLTSFVAAALHEHVREEHAESMLLAFTLPPAVLYANTTHMLMGVLDFTDAFSATWKAKPLCHFPYAHTGCCVHFMTMEKPRCTASQASQRTRKIIWIGREESL